MTTKVITVSPSIPLTEAAKSMIHNDIGALPVLDKNHRLIGIFYKREVLKVIAT
ncbi:MAG: CBS domain-containing protein [Nitrososphaerales archaeon]